MKIIHLEITDVSKGLLRGYKFYSVVLFEYLLICDIFIVHGTCFWLSFVQHSFSQEINSIFRFLMQYYIGISYINKIFNKTRREIFIKLTISLYGLCKSCHSEHTCTVTVKSSFKVWSELSRSWRLISNTKNLTEILTNPS